MQKKLFKMLVCGFLMLLPMQASASTYRGYTYDGWDQAVPSQIGYEPAHIYGGAGFGGETGRLKTPRDLFVTDDHRVFILDSGNNRVVIVNRSFQVEKVIEEWNLNGESTFLNNPAGIFVDADGMLYITDPGNERVVISNEDGVVKKILAKPQSNLLNKELEFKPQKVLTDSMGNIYVTAAGVYQGALIFKPDGEFEGFFGNNTVEVSAMLLLDRFWKNLLTGEQAGNISNYIPEEITSFAIDRRDFVYSVTQDLNVNEKLKKLNPMGVNVLKHRDFGEQEKIFVGGQSSASQFVDVCVSDKGYIDVLDARYNRIFHYDREGRLLFIFGGTGLQAGTFQSAAAVACMDADVLVLDSQKGTITVFSPTAFGELVGRAIEYYDNGQYAQSVELWQDIFRQDHNYTIGYVSIAKTYLADNQYQLAADYFKKGNDREGNSVAFEAWRNQVIQKNFPIVFVVLLVLIGLFVWKFNRSKGKRKEPVNRKKISPFRFLLHPIDSAEEMKQKNAGSFLYAAAILAVWTILTIVQYSLTGFRFNPRNPEQMNVPMIFLGTLPLFAIWVGVNWGVTTLMNGKGKMKDILIGSAYSLIPYVSAMLICLPLSHILTLSESVFIDGIMMIGIGWSIFVLLGVLSGIHEYRFTQTILSTFFTIIGMLIAVFLIFLVCSLIQQAALFVYSIINELLYRL